MTSPVVLRAGVLLTALLVFSPAIAGSYDSDRAALEQRRQELSSRMRAAAEADRAAVREEARTVLKTAVRQQLLPPWFGTTWAYEGISAVPGEGEIACGYLVSTLAQHAGMKVQRYKLAQRGAEDIARSFAPDDEVKILRDLDPAEVASRVAAMGEGIYVVGLSFHVGFLVVDGETVELCHSAYYGTTGVTCEPAASSRGLADSSVFVVAPFLSDRTVDAWLSGSAIKTHGL